MCSQLILFFIRRLRNVVFLDYWEKARFSKTCFLTSLTDMIRYNCARECSCDLIDTRIRRAWELGVP